MHRSALIESAAARRVPVSSSMPDSPTKHMEPAHVPGLYLICAVELYERLAGAMVFSLLVLYLNECQGLGTGLAAKVASYIQMLSYAAGVLGGGLADRGLGARRVAFWGSVLLWLGYSALGSLSRTSSGLWAAGVLVIAGHGLFKPNCTALVGALYASSDSRRASAFVWFYYSINVGSMLGPCIGGIVRTSVGWSVTFRVAAISIAVSSVLLAIGRRYLTDGASASTLTPESDRATATIDASHPTVASHVGALVLVVAMLALFGAALSHSYGTLLLWARDDARRTLLGHAIPPDFFAALPAAFVLLLGPVLDRVIKALAARGYAPSEPGKFAVGMLLCALAYGLMLAASLVHSGPSGANPLWLVACKVALALGELLGVPVGLALVERLAPLRRKGLTLGLCYLAHAVGYWLGGEFSALWPRWSHARFFGVLTVGCIISAALIQSQTQRFAKALTQKL